MKTVIYINSKFAGQILHAMLYKLSKENIISTHDFLYTCTFMHPTVNNRKKLRQIIKIISDN